MTDDIELYARLNVYGFILENLMARAIATHPNPDANLEELRQQFKRLGANFSAPPGEEMASAMMNAQNRFALQFLDEVENRMKAATKS